MKLDKVCIYNPESCSPVPPYSGFHEASSLKQCAKHIVQPRAGYPPLESSSHSICRDSGQQRDHRERRVSVPASSLFKSIGSAVRALWWWSFIQISFFPLSISHFLPIQKFYDSRTKRKYPITQFSLYEEADSHQINHQHDSHF